MSSLVFFKECLRQSTFIFRSYKSWGNTSSRNPIIHQKISTCHAVMTADTRKDDGAEKRKSVKERLLQRLDEQPYCVKTKVTIVGCGEVGMAAAYAILMKGLVTDLALVSSDGKKAEGEMLDLKQVSIFFKNPKIFAGNDFGISYGSRVCVIAAGARQEKGESRLNLLHKNVEIMKRIIPELMKHNRETVILMVTNPVDLMTHVAWKLSGLPVHSVIGSGTSLDTARFRFWLAKRLGVAPTSVRAWILGEHGDSSVPLWSNVNVAGLRLRDLDPTLATSEDKHDWEKLHKEVVQSAATVIKLKGYTSTAIGTCVCNLVEAILRNNDTVYPVSTQAKGFHGIERDVFLSLPCVLHGRGVSHVVRNALSEKEECLMQKSADILHKELSKIKLH